jgi:hypothetical protein
MSLRKPYGSRKTKTKTVDVIIVGAGIAGLYAASLLKNNQSFLILEKNDQDGIGGRIKVVDFHGTPCAVGAGIGRHNDIYLKRLLHQFKIKFQESIKRQRYSFDRQLTDKDLQQMILKLKHQSSTTNEPIEAYGTRVLGEAAFDEFVKMSGYEDFLNEPKNEYFNTLADAEELFFPFKMFTFSWKDLLEKMIHSVGGRKTILTEMNVMGIDVVNLDDVEKSTYFLLKVQHRNLKKPMYFSCSKLIMATPADSLKALLPQPLVKEVYSHIHGQPFVKVLGLFKKPHWNLANQLIPFYTVTDTLLKKMYPMDHTKGIYMICYSDNQSCLELFHLTKKLTKRQKLKMYEHLLQETFNQLLTLDDVHETFWQSGTHFFDASFNKASPPIQLPLKNLIVVGEAVNAKHGWVENALQSVELVKNKLN